MNVRVSYLVFCLGPPFYTLIMVVLCVVYLFIDYVFIVTSLFYYFN